MKQQVTLPVSFLFSITVSSFMLGTIIGSIITYVLLRLAPAALYLDNSQQKKENVVYKKQAIVTKVIDGDTIIVKLNGKLEKVRYFGIDAPEEKTGSERTYYAKEAYEKNKQLVEGKEVHIIWDTRDSMNRLLAYVFIDDIFVNAELLQHGYAAIYRRTQKLKKHIYSGLFAKMERQARSNHAGIWNYQEKLQWEQKNRLESSSKTTFYIADHKYFHRPECPKAREIKFKQYYYRRENAIRDSRIPCELCKP